MALSINTNIGALQAQKYLSQASQALGRNQERLASGLRLNSAADDAAGVAISARMTAQIKGMSQAVRNANDAISMVQTAESGLKRMEDILNQMREKAVQAANETNTSADRSSLDDEYQQLLSELDRIAREQSFNGLSLLDGTRGTATFQVGPDTDSVDSISVNMSTSMKTADIGKRYYGTLGLATGTPAIGSSELEVSGVGVTFGGLTTGVKNATQGKTTASAWGIAKAINSNANISAVAEALTVTQAAANTSVKFKVTDAGDSAGSATYKLVLNGTTAFSAKISLGGTTTMATRTLTVTEVMNAVNNKAGTLGITATKTAGGKIQLNNTAGGYVKITESIATANASAHSVSNTNGLFGNTFDTGTDVTLRTNGKVYLTHTNSIAVNDTAAGAEFTNFAASGSTTFTNQTVGMNATKVTSVSDAQTAIDRIDAALGDVNTFRGTFGAAQNRFEYTIENLENSVQNLTDARSRIMDADIAKEAAGMMMNNVRRQAASAVLAQANMNPQLALQLLGA